MKMRTIVSTLLLSMFAVQAHASRQAVTCTSLDAGRKLNVYLDFDPAATQETVWSNGSIITYKLADKNGQNTTSARVGLDIPSTMFKAPYSGKFLLTSLYDVNTLQKAGSGYSSRFNNEDYRGFHGTDDDRRWDAMVYIPNSVIGQNAKSFPGLTTIQMDLMDEGYYHIDLKCSSEIR